MVPLAGGGGPKRGACFISRLVRAASAHQHNRFPFRLFRQDGAPERLRVLHDVILARERRGYQPAHDQAGEQESGFHRDWSTTGVSRPAL